MLWKCCTQCTSKFGCESWTIKKAKCWRIDALNCGVEKTLESLLDCKEIQSVNAKGNQSWIFIGRTDAEAQVPIFGYPMERTDSLEKTLMLGKIEGRRRRGQQRMRCLDGIMDSMDWVWVNSRSWWWTGRPGVLQFMGSQRVRHDWATELNWTELTGFGLLYFHFYAFLCIFWFPFLFLLWFVGYSEVCCLASMCLYFQ